MKRTTNIVTGSAILGRLGICRVAGLACYWYIHHDDGITPSRIHLNLDRKRLNPVDGSRTNLGQHGADCMWEKARNCNPVFAATADFLRFLVAALGGHATEGGLRWRRTVVAERRLKEHLR